MPSLHAYLNLSQSLKKSNEKQNFSSVNVGWILISILCNRYADILLSKVFFVRPYGVTACVHGNYILFTRSRLFKPKQKMNKVVL